MGDAINNLAPRQGLTQPHLHEESGMSHFSGSEIDDLENSQSKGLQTQTQLHSIQHKDRIKMSNRARNNQHSSQEQRRAANTQQL